MRGCDQITRTLGAERDYRRTASQGWDQAAAVRGRADKINAQADAPETMRDLANSVGPRAKESATRAEAEFTEPE